MTDQANSERVVTEVDRARRSWSAACFESDHGSCKMLDREQYCQCPCHAPEPAAEPRGGEGIDYEVTFDQVRFAKQAQIVDWGVLVSEWQGSATVCVVALDHAGAADLLEGAARAIHAALHNEVGSG